LGRLASFYPACRQCEHRHDTGGLSSVETRRWDEVSRRQSAAPHFESEQFTGTTAAGLDAEAVHRLSAALGVLAWREQPSRRRPPVVVLGTDGHWTTAELFASACAALQWTGCRTVEAGAATSPALACLSAERVADAALWIGNASGESQTIALKFWGASGTPWSSPGKLDTLVEVWQATTVDRPCRTTGGAERARAADVYLPSLAPMFHGLRPLRFVLDTTCQPLVRAWRELTQASACEIISSGQAPPAEAASGCSLVERRLAAVAERVLVSGAHFGMWIDGDGEACLLVDERGRAVSAETFLVALAAYVCGRQPGARVLLESSSSGECQRQIERLGAEVSRAPSTRQAMSEWFVERRAALAGGPSGRFWFASSPPAPDALLTLCFWLSVLSKSDRAVSEVLDAAQAGEYKEF
jgi:phosphoglucosamine mutase